MEIGIVDAIEHSKKSLGDTMVKERACDVGGGIPGLGMLRQPHVGLDGTRIRQLAQLFDRELCPGAQSGCI